MRKRAAQELNPKMGRMGAEDPSRDFRPGLQHYDHRVTTTFLRVKNSMPSLP
jgi:hypothetical protein